MARRITSTFVKRLALCKRGKNGMTTLFKSITGRDLPAEAVKRIAETVL